MDSLVEASLDWSEGQADDFEQLLELCEAIDYFDDPVEQVDAGVMHQCILEAGDQFRSDAVVGRDRGGTIVAFGWNRIEGLSEGRPKLWLSGGVHPAWRHKHIGARLLEWQLDRAHEWWDEVRSDPGRDLHSPLWVGAHVDAKLTSKAGLFIRSGMTAERWYTDLHRLLSDPSSAVVLPELPDIAPLRLQQFDPGRSEDLRHAHNEAFAARTGFCPVEPSQWQYSLARPAARPEWSWMAMDGDQVVGYALASVYAEDWDEQGFSEGWIDRIGVRPGWRRHGLGEALLVATMRSFADAGLEAAGLGVDTEDPEVALGLYERLGFEAEEMVVRYGMEFPLESH